MSEIVRCRRCETLVDSELVSDGYSYACLECDEDLYTFETYVEEGE